MCCMCAGRSAAWRIARARKARSRGAKSAWATKHALSVRRSTRFFARLKCCSAVRSLEYISYIHENLVPASTRTQHGAWDESYWAFESGRSPLGGQARQAASLVRQGHTLARKVNAYGLCGRRDTENGDADGKPNIINVPVEKSSRV